MVRVDRALYERAMAAARASGLTMTEWVAGAIESILNDSDTARCPVGHNDCAVFAALACRTCPHKETE